MNDDRPTSAAGLPSMARVEITILRTRRQWIVSARATSACGASLPLSHQPAIAPTTHRSAATANAHAKQIAAQFTDESRDVYATIKNERTHNAPTFAF